MFYIGIDPGAKGGITVLDDEMCIAFPYHDQALLEVCQLYQGRCVCTVEKVHSMPGQGVSSTFTFGRNYGVILGILMAFQIPYTEVTPQVWKKYFGLSRDKQESIDKCHELFPDLELYPTKRCRKESDGMAESALISVWGMKNVWSPVGGIHS